MPYYDYALDLILDADSPNNEILTEEQHELVESAAEMLYGLIHVRYILTSRGMGAMFEKFKSCEFGRCPRVHCNGQACLPIGTSDVPRQATVKIFCPKCCDIYYPRSKYQARPATSPSFSHARHVSAAWQQTSAEVHGVKTCCPGVLAGLFSMLMLCGCHRLVVEARALISSRLYCVSTINSDEPRVQGNVDGVFFGTTFPHLLLMTYPSLRPPRPTETYVPRVFGFKLHESALTHPPADATPVQRQNGAPCAYQRAGLCFAWLSVAKHLRPCWRSAEPFWRAEQGSAAAQL